MSQATNSFVDKNKDRLLEELKNFLRIPSISTLPEHAPTSPRRRIRRPKPPPRGPGKRRRSSPPRSTRWFTPIGCTRPASPPSFATDTTTFSRPIRWSSGSSPPFEPDVRDGNIYARGSCDDKGQMYMHIKAVEALRAVNGTLPVNLKFLIEGEEEIGGESIGKYVAENPPSSKPTSRWSPTPNSTPRHPDPVHRAARPRLHGNRSPRPGSRSALRPLRRRRAQRRLRAGRAAFENERRQRRTSRFRACTTTSCRPRPPKRRAGNALPFDEKEFLQDEVGSTRLTGEPGYSVLERIWARPTLEVHGIAGGFTAAGAKTVIPAKATAKVSMRLVPNQDPDKIIAAFQEIRRRKHARGDPVGSARLERRPGDQRESGSSRDRRCRARLQRYSRPRTVFIRSGGSIPIVGDFARISASRPS